jgi:23S rRNA pseudouridine1911/1915/1917 synthase
VSTVNISILFEDELLLVIDKPVGLVVNRATTVKGDTVQDWVEQQYSIKQQESKTQKLEPGIHEFETTVEDFEARSGIVHRIDKETSGCLIVAKTFAAFVALQKSFKERLVHKTYAALVHGKVAAKSGEINAPVGRQTWNRSQFGVVPGGKEAHTKYTVEKYYSDSEKNQYSFLTLEPTTGRTHQLRVHLKYLGHPIVGDYLYAGRKQQKADRLWCPRVFLHASKITFPHPTDSHEVTVQAPLPEQLRKVLGSLTALE